jgi:hypothetical protein
MSNMNDPSSNLVVSIMVIGGCVWLLWQLTKGPLGAGVRSGATTGEHKALDWIWIATVLGVVSIFWPTIVAWLRYFGAAR